MCTARTRCLNLLHGVRRDGNPPNGMVKMICSLVRILGDLYVPAINAKVRIALS